MNKPSDEKKELVTTPLAEAQEEGIRGVTGCVCGSTSGTLVGGRFICNNVKCKYGRKKFSPFLTPEAKATIKKARQTGRGV